MQVEAVELPQNETEDMIPKLRECHQFIRKALKQKSPCTILVACRYDNTFKKIVQGNIPLSITTTITPFPQ